MPRDVPSFRPPRLRLQRPSQTFYASATWQAVRKTVLLRDHYRCRVCHRLVNGREAHVDHILPREEGGSDTAENLQVLCRDHHGEKTRAEQARKGYMR